MNFSRIQLAELECTDDLPNRWDILVRRGAAYDARHFEWLSPRD